MTNLLACGLAILIVTAAGALAVALECWHGPGEPPCSP
jgi:hypothetical protein